MGFCLRPNVCKKCGKPLTLFEGWTCLECEKAEQEPCGDEICPCEDETKECIENCFECEYSSFYKGKTCEDTVSRQAVLDLLENTNNGWIINEVEQLPSVQLKAKTGRCKECQYFEYDSVAKVDGVPLIVAHEICNKWGDGCKTSENGYCFMFEQKGEQE